MLLIQRAPRHPLVFALDAAVLKCALPAIFTSPSRYNLSWLLSMSGVQIFIDWVESEELSDRSLSEPSGKDILLEIDPTPCLGNKFRLGD